jgi:hypothetical protein
VVAVRDFTPVELREIALGLKLLEIRRRRFKDDHETPRRLKEEFRQAAAERGMPFSAIDREFDDNGEPRHPNDPGVDAAGRDDAG